MANGWLPQKQRQGRGRPAGAPDTALKLFEKLNRGVGSEEIHVSKGLFVEARGPEHLLALPEMHSLQDLQWCQMLRLRLCSEYNPQTDGPIEKEIKQAIEKLIVA